MNWQSILKIKNPEGEYWIVTDVDEFTKILRRQLDIFGLKRWTGKSGKESKSRVVVKETWISDEILQIVISVRNPSTQSREYFRITLKEDDTGDFYYATALGPGLELGENEVVANEYEIQNKIIQSVKRVIEG